MAKAKPGDLLYASAGKGTATHLAAELFNTTAGTKMTPVHYKGGGETLKDLLSGQVKVMFSTIPPVLGFVRDGRLRGLATTPPKRDPALPDLPTIAESGAARLRRAALVRPGRAQGNAAAGDRPAGDGRQAGARISEDTQKRLAAAGYAPLPGTPEQFGAFYKSEVAKWAKVVEAVGSLGRTRRAVEAPIGE